MPRSPKRSRKSPTRQRGGESLADLMNRNQSGGSMASDAVSTGITDASFARISAVLPPAAQMGGTGGADTLAEFNNVGLMGSLSRSSHLHLPGVKPTQMRTYGGAKRRAPKRASPKRASPKRHSPKRASPKRHSPKR